jgi:L-amino acid N-acyltransferase YncA
MLSLIPLVTYERCAFTALRAEGEASGLFLAHWCEATADTTIPLNVDWERFRAFETAGMEVCVAARRNGRLIGYAVYLVFPHLHYRGWIVADSDVFFLEPEDRKGWIGINLFRAVEAALRAKGVDEVYQRVKLHVKPGRGRGHLGTLFRFLGYRAVELTYRKKL